MINVAQYNILSIELASKYYYVNTNTKYLQPDFRWQLLKDKLLTKINNQYIICLQEVCYHWLEKLIPFFNLHNYQYQYTQYTCHQGYVGSLTAYPHHFQLEAIKIVNIGDYIEKRVTKIVDPIDKNDLWFKSIIKKNMLLCLKLSDGHKSFCVINYHMPQSHQYQSVGLLHLISCIQIINKFANNTKYIFAGDFNFKPDSLLYKVITQGGSYKNVVMKTTLYDTSQFNLKNATPLVDAYKNRLVYTNYVHTDDDPWYGCIDYIFLSQGWIVNHRDDIVNDFSEGPFPDLYEPSDHLMIGVQLI